jgi:transposase
MPARMIAWDWWSDEPSMLLMGSSGGARYGSMAPIRPRGWKRGVRGVKQTHTIDLEATTHQEGKGFHVIPWRWAVERTLAWWLNDRRQSRDYERLTANSAAMIQMSMIRLLLNR